MKIIELLSPKGNSIIKVPGYCKNLLIKNNYKSLPKNTFLKKIKIFLYLKFLSRIRSIVFLLSKIKIKFKNPPQKQVVIFDKEGSENLKPILKKDKYYIEYIPYLHRTREGSRFFDLFELSRPSGPFGSLHLVFRV